MATEIIPASDFKIMEAGQAHASQHLPPLHRQLPPPHFKKNEPSDDHLTARLVLKVLVAHQRSSEWWRGHDAHEYLREKAGELIEHFDMRTHRGVRLAIPLFCVDDKMKFKTIGCYNPAPNGYALAGTVSFNLDRLPMDDCLLLAYLLKFLACFCRHFDGGSGEFDKQAKDRLKEYGVAFDSKGNVAVNRLKGFADFLAGHGIPIPEGIVVMPRPARGKSTLKRWECECQGCQVGTAEFFANCPKCGQPFRLGKHIKKKPRSKELARSSG